MKKTWINYYLINILKRSNKFFVNNWFDKTIIKKNWNKVRLLTNTILDKFLKEIIILNIISFTKTRKIIAKKVYTTNYSNHYSAINNIIDILKLILLLAKNTAFKKQFSQIYKAEILD